MNTAAWVLVFFMGTGTWSSPFMIYFHTEQACKTAIKTFTESQQKYMRCLPTGAEGQRR